MLAILCVLFSMMAGPAWGQIVNSQAELMVPFAPNGTAEIPLLNDYKPGYNHDLLTAQRKATCQVQFDEQGVTFSFSVAFTPSFVPAGATQRDDSRVWQDSGARVEILLIPGADAACRHYIINSAGGIYDEMGNGADWNGGPEVAGDVQADRWLVRVKVPFSDLGVATVDGSEMKASVIVDCQDPRDPYTVTWTAVGPDFKNLAAFGTLKFAKESPFASRVRLSPVTYGDQGAVLGVDYEVKNPSAAQATLRLAEQTLAIPAQGVVAFSQKVVLPAERGPIVTFTLKGILNYRHAVTNELIPKLQMVAMDLNTFKVKIWNLDFLGRFGKVTKIFIDDRLFLESELSELEKKEIDIRGLVAGDHVLTFVLSNDHGQEFVRYAHKFQTFVPRKYDYDITRLDASRYFPPIAFGNDQLTAAQSSFDLADGVLPKQIRVKGRSLLAAPVQIRYAGQDMGRGKQTKALDANKNRYAFTAKGTAGDMELTIKADYEYDGFSWYAVTLKKQDGTPLSYEPLEIVIPLDLGPEVLVGQSGPTSDRMYVNDTVMGIGYVKEVKGSWDLLTTDNLDMPMTNCLTLATDADEQYRGLCFISEGPRGWNLKDYDRTYQIRRDGAGKVTLTVRVSDGLTLWKQDEITFAFGLQPIPMRAYPSNFHGYYRLDNCFDPKNFKKRYEEGKAKGEIAFFGDRVKMGATTEVAFENWTDFHSYWKVGGPREEDILAYSQAAHEAGMKVIYYYGGFISNQIPEYALYHELILAKTDTRPQDPDKKGFQPYMFYKIGDPEQNSYGQCPKSFWSDHWLCGIEEGVFHYDMDGLYLDGALAPGYCMNTKHGCGVRDPYGRMIPTYTTRENRRTAEILYTIGQKKSPDFIIDLHMNEPCPPFMGLVSAFYTGEAQHLFEPKFSRMRPGEVRGWLNGRLYGVPGDLLLRPPYHLNIGWAQSLLVDGYIRCCSGGGPFWIGLTQRLWRMYTEYGMTNDTFTPFFSTQNKIRKDNPDIYVSYYDTQKALILVVSNYMQETEQTVTLDLSPFQALTAAFGTDVWYGSEKYPIKAGKLTLAIPALSLRLLVIGKT
jgi:hypothetical protein